MTDLSTLQASVLATEVNLAKNYAIKSNTSVNDLSSEVTILKTELYNINNKLNDLIKKVDILVSESKKNNLNIIN